MIRKIHAMGQWLGLGLVALSGWAPVKTAPWLHAQVAPLAFPQAYSHGEPSDAEQFMLELVNRARANPAAEAARFGIDLNEGLSSGTLTASPKQALAFNANLIAATRGHSQWMLNENQFDHTGEGGSTPGDRMRGAGYVFTGSWTYGENIALQGTSRTPNLEEIILSSHEGLFVDEDIDGRGHRLNLLKEAFQEIGIGVQTGRFDFGGDELNSVMMTQDFARSGGSPGPFLVGVIYQDRDRDGFYSMGEGLAGVTVQPAQGTAYAISSRSGGFAIPIKGLAGPLQVTVSGGAWPLALAKTVELTGNNVKLDFESVKDRPVTPAVIRLGRPQYLGAGSVQFQIQGSMGQTIVVQRSLNLKTWTEVRVVTLNAAVMTFADAAPAGCAAVYYRALAR